MKKLAFLFVSFAFAISTFAQTEKGNLLIGGNAGFELNFINNFDNVFAISVSPNIAKFVQDGLAIGGSFSASYTKGGDSNLTSIGVSPMARYYFPTAGGPAFFFHVSAGFVSIRNDNGFNDPDRSTSAIFNGGPGIAFFLTDQISIEGALLYTRVTDNFVNSNLGLVFGVQAYLPGGDKD